MPKKTEPVRVALICNNLVREHGTLRLLQKALEKRMRADVKIIGSLAEIQRTYYSLFQFQPHIVFLSQLQEKCCRDIAEYVKQSGGKVVIMPEEITPAKVVESLILNPSASYNKLLDLAVLPGKVMYDFFVKTDISKEKIVITGSPKIDVEILQKGMSRKNFCKQFNLSVNKKNVFIFTSFPHTGMDYFKTDSCFTDQLKLIDQIQKVIRGTQEKYLKDLPRLCAMLEDFQVILKPHPLEDLSYYQSLHIPNLSVISGVSVLDCMESIDLAVHWNSTVCTSCWMHGISTFQYSPIKKHDWLLSGFTKGNPLFSDHEKLAAAVIKFFKVPKKLGKKYFDFQKQYFLNNFYRLDGKSAERIASRTASLIAKSKNQSLSYTPRFRSLVYGVVAMERVLGIGKSRRFLSLLTGNYNWRYATENYLP